MYKEKFIKIKYQGKCICKVSVGFTKYIVSTDISVIGLKFEEWQCDGGFYHNVSWVDYDKDSATVLHKDKYIIFSPTGEIKQGKYKITKLLEIIEFGDLKEIGYVE